MSENIDMVIQTLRETQTPIPRVNIPLLIKSLEELQRMIGLEDIKTSIVNQVLHAIFFAEDPDPEVLYNVMIVGPPGVGKTLLIQTLARIWSAIELVGPSLKKKTETFQGSQHTVWWLRFVKEQIVHVNDELGEAEYTSPEVNVNVHERLHWVHEVCTELLSSSDIPTQNVYVGHTPKICYIRRDMAIGTHQGETAKWTYDLLSSAIGGVVVLDEFYSMINGEDGNDEYGRECVNGINQFITDHPDTRFIIAGYEENIRKSIFRYQPGMESRFPWVFKIEGYKPSELTDMFLKRFNLQLHSDVTREWILEFIKTNIKAFSAYGRSIVQFCFRVGVIVASRAFYEKKSRENTFVTKEDFQKALIELKRGSSNEECHSENILAMYN